MRILYCRFWAEINFFLLRKNIFQKIWKVEKCFLFFDRNTQGAYIRELAAIGKHKIYKKTLTTF